MAGRRTRSPHSRTWPRRITFVWDDVNELLLREVRPGLFVGGEHTRSVRKWRGLVDLYGSKLEHTAKVTLDKPFIDDLPIPRGVLDDVWEFVVPELKKGKVLLHCQAGLSRSASAAYAVLRRLDGLDHAEALRRVEVPEDTWDYYPCKPTLHSAKLWVRRHKKRR